MKDDRGEPRRVLDPEGVCQWPAPPGERLRGVAERVAAASGGGHQGAMHLLGILVAIYLALAFGIPMLPRVIGIPNWLAPAVFIAVGTVGIVWQRNRRLAVHGARVAEVLVRDGLCGVCAYNLYGLPTERDGCVVCPECGGAWRSDRIVRSEPFLAAARWASALMPIHMAIGRRWNRLTVLDARGARVALAHPRLRRELGTATGGHRGRLLAARSRMSWIGREARWPIGGFFIALGFVVAAVSLFGLTGTTGRGGVFDTLTLAIPGVAMVALGAGVLWGNFGYSTSLVVAAMRREGLCPSCAAEIGDAGECALCGAAWGTPGIG